MIKKELSKVTRLEIINHTDCDSCEGEGTISIEGQPGRLECPACHGSGVVGREVIFNDDQKEVQASLQDGGRTLKIFVNKREQ